MPEYVTCPKCKHQFEISQALSDQLAEKIRQELEGQASARLQEVEQRAAELDNSRAELEKARGAIDERVRTGIEEERKKLLEEARKKAEEAACATCGIT